MKSIDEFFYRSYNEAEYDCLDFINEVWLFLTGQDLHERLGALVGTAAGRRIERHQRAAFRPLEAPCEPCLAFMSHPRFPPHVGVYLEEKIIHIRPDGVEFQPPDVASRLFHKVKYYLPCNT